MKHVRIYSGPDCPHCDKAKVLLKEKGVEFEEIDVSADPDAARRIFEETGERTIPQIFIDEFHVGGCAELYAHEETGELDSMLGLGE